MKLLWSIIIYMYEEFFWKPISVDLNILSGDMADGVDLDSAKMGTLRNNSFIRQRPLIYHLFLPGTIRT